MNITEQDTAQTIFVYFSCSNTPPNVHEPNAEARKPKKFSGPAAVDSVSTDSGISSAFSEEEVDGGNTISSAVSTSVSTSKVFTNNYVPSNFNKPFVGIFYFEHGICNLSSVLYPRHQQSFLDRQKLLELDRSAVPYPHPNSKKMIPTGRTKKRQKVVTKPNQIDRYKNPRWNRFPILQTLLILPLPLPQKVIVKMKRMSQSLKFAMSSHNKHFVWKNQR